MTEIEPIDRHQAAYMAAVAEALEKIPFAEPSYGGSFYVSRAIIGYDGEDTHWQVTANEFNGYEITRVLDS